MAKIAPQLRVWLEKYNLLMAAWLAKGFVATPQVARDGLANLTRTMVSRIPDLAIVIDEKVETLDHNIPVRVYHPQPDAALPVLIYLHFDDMIYAFLNLERLVPECCRRVFETMALFLTDIRQGD